MNCKQQRVPNNKGLNKCQTDNDQCECNMKTNLDTSKNEQQKIYNDAEPQRANHDEIRNENACELQCNYTP